MTTEYISSCFGSDLRAFIPTSHPPTTRPEVKLSILPSHMLPTLLSMKLKYLLTCKEEVENTWCLLCILILGAATLQQTLLLSGINNERNRQVSLFLSTAYMQHVNHGCNDVQPTFSPSIYLGFSHSQPHTLWSIATSAWCWSQSSFCSCCRVELSRLACHWSHIRGEEGAANLCTVQWKG